MLACLRCSVSAVFCLFIKFEAIIIENVDIDFTKDKHETMESQQQRKTRWTNKK